MPSVIQGYEYDIFISYRHKDNRSGWVTEFIKALKNEVDSTFKENISIYFDENPVGGLLETHQVDKSLATQLNSVVFVPIVSQTYCDPASFAWQNEFCAFNQTAHQQEIGRDIKLSSGNVASRILPVTIHDLEAADIQMLEEKLQGKYRGVDFMFKAPGVNRALLPDDQPEDNLYQLSYRDQVNKIANATKEVIYGILYPNKTAYGTAVFLDEDSQYLTKKPPEVTKTEPAPDEKSIAVLPFVSLAQDSSQDYFADGITENILILLASLRQLRVISRTSVMQYKKTTKTAPEIARELAVKYILEGSAQSHANKVRINVQLIDAVKDEPLWSKVFVESMDDIFTVQDKVAEVVAEQLHASISKSPVIASHQAPTKNLEAYDLFLKGRHAFNQWNVDGYKTASAYFEKAIRQDPELKEAYSYMASSYSARMSWNGDLSPAQAKPLIDQYLGEAFKRGATDNDYLTKAFVEFFIEKNFKASEDFLKKALEINPNNATVLFTYNYVLCMAGRLEEAHTVIEQAKRIEPHSVAYFNYQGIYHYLSGKYDEAVQVFQEGMKLFPRVVRFYDHLGRVYLTNKCYEQSRDILLEGLRSTSLRQPSMLGYLAAAYSHLNAAGKSAEILQELEGRSQQNEKGVNYYLALAYSAVGDTGNAVKSLTKAKQSNDIDLIWMDIDPLLATIRNAPQRTTLERCDFAGAEAFILDKLRKELPENLHYHNIDHTLDVLESALRIAAHQQLSISMVPLLRVAALFHDSGFTRTYKNHEQSGCEIASESLPGFGFNNDQLNIICGMIMATKIPQSPQNEIERILCDADLDYLGRDDFYAIGNQLFEEMKGRGYLETDREWNLTQKVFLENHRYHTDYAKENREEKKQQHLDEVLEKLKR